jgi:iron-sulfur cluster assembly accessory protein
MTAEVNTELSQSTATGTDLIILTEVAAGKIKSYLEQSGPEAEGKALRVTIRPGGCAGLMQEIGFDDRNTETDYFQESHGVAIVVDPLSLEYVNGLTIDYVDTIAEQGFLLENPNKQSSCACGNSFC